MIVKVQPHTCHIFRISCLLFTVFVFQSHLLASGLSPLSDDEQSETCDSPEDPMSPAESVVVTCVFFCLFV